MPRHPTAGNVQVNLTLAPEAYDLLKRLVLQRGFTPVGSPVRYGACDVRETPPGFTAVERPECQAPTACHTRVGARL